MADTYRFVISNDLVCITVHWILHSFYSRKQTHLFLRLLTLVSAALTPVHADQTPIYAGLTPVTAHTLHILLFPGVLYSFLPIV